MRRCDVVVIGAGAMGSATAWHLARRGVDVVLLEQFEPGHGRGSSHGATRIFRFAYPDPTYVAMAQASLPLWRELEADTGETLLETTGGVDIGEAVTLAAVEDAMRAGPAEVEHLGAGEAMERWPGIRPDPSETVLFSPDSGRIWADRTVAALHRRAADLGAEVRFSEPVTSIHPEGVLTEVDEYQCQTVVVTAGAWLAGLLANTGIQASVPRLLVTQEQTFHFPSHWEGWPTFIHHRRGEATIYGLETPGEGIKVAEHHTGTPTDPDARSFTVDEIGRQRVIRYVSVSMPGLVASPAAESTCLYTSTPDASFILERYGNLVVGSACSGHGFKFTPLIGRTLADLAVPAATPTPAPAAAEQ